MNKMQKAFAAVGIPRPKPQRNSDGVQTRRSMIQYNEGRNELFSSIFGKWPNQLKRPEFGLVKEMIWRAKK